MNKLVILAITLSFILPTTHHSFANTPEIENNIFILVQTSVRNSDGQLVVYLESSKFTEVNTPALKSFLDFEASRGTDPIMTIDGENYQIIRRVQIQIFDSDGLVASTVLSDNIDGKPVLLARFAHDGYPKISGDSMESIWTFIIRVS